jgi:hypothetical protein
MRNTLLATIAALSLAVAVPALAVGGNAPDVATAPADHAVIAQPKAHYLLADGGDYYNNTQPQNTYQQLASEAVTPRDAQLLLADGGDYYNNTQPQNNYRQAASLEVVHHAVQLLLVDGGDYYNNTQPQNAQQSI